MEFFGDEIDRIAEIDPLTGEIKRALEHIACIFRHRIMLLRRKMKQCSRGDREGTGGAGGYFKENDKLLEAQRIA